MQRAALYPESELAVDHVTVTKVHEQSSLGGLRAYAPDGRAAFDCGGQHAELVELAHRRRMQEHARAASDGWIVAFKVRYAMPGTSQVNGCGDACDAITNDGDVQRAFHVIS